MPRNFLVFYQFFSSLSRLHKSASHFQNNPSSNVLIEKREYFGHLMKLDRESLYRKYLCNRLSFKRWACPSQNSPYKPFLLNYVDIVDLLSGKGLILIISPHQICKMKLEKLQLKIIKF